MTEARGRLANAPARAYRPIVHVVRALGMGFVLLAWRCVAPLVYAATWIRGPWRAHIGPTPHAPTAAAPTEALPAAPTEALDEPRGSERALHRTHGYAVRSAPGDFDCVEVEPDFDERIYPLVFRALQLGPRSKLLDLRLVKQVKMDLFERLADAWCVAPGTVPRLAIVLGYESWVVFRHVAARRLRPLVDKRVEVEMLYAQQIDSVPAWFKDGHARHDQLRAVIDWLRTQWRPTAIWPMVLGTTAVLVQASGATDEVPELLLELVGLALAFEDPEGVEQAIKHARAAVHWVGEAPSVARCRALRALATATFRQGDTEVALALLDTAIASAIMIGDRVEEATAIAEIGFHALRNGHFARAEDRFRCALALLSADDLPYLRATLHHHLALALHKQHKDADEAEYHATTALALRWDRSSRRASEDGALLARIRARRAGR